MLLSPLDIFAKSLSTNIALPLTRLASTLPNEPVEVAEALTLFPAAIFRLPPLSTLKDSPVLLLKINPEYA